MKKLTDSPVQYELLPPKERRKTINAYTETMADAQAVQNAITANDNSKRLMDVPKFANLSKESSKLQRLEHGMIPENSQSSAIYYIPTPRGS